MKESTLKQLTHEFVRGELTEHQYAMQMAKEIQPEAFVPYSGDEWEKE